MFHKRTKQGILAVSLIGCAALLATPALATAVPNAPPGYFQENPRQFLRDRGPASFGSMPFDREGPYVYSGPPRYYGYGPRARAYGYGPGYYGYGRRAGIGIGLGIL